MPCHGRIFDLSDAFPPRTAFQTQPSFPLRASIVTEAFISFFSPLCAYSRLFRLKCTVSSVPIVRLRSFAHALAHFFVIAHSALSLFERSFCTFYNNFVSFLVTFRDSDLNIFPVCVYIFPRRIPAHQVSSLVCQIRFRERY